MPHRNTGWKYLLLGILHYLVLCYGLQTSSKGKRIKTTHFRTCIENYLDYNTNAAGLTNGSVTD